MSDRPSHRRPNGEFGPFQRPTCTWERIIFTSHRMISKRPATRTFCPRMYSKSSSAFLIWDRKSPATCTASRRLTTHKWVLVFFSLECFGLFVICDFRWKKSDALLWCHNGVITLRLPFRTSYRNTSSWKRWNRLVGCTLNQMSRLS